MACMTQRIGEISQNKYGTAMKIVEYINKNNIIVEFQDEFKYRTHTNYQAFKNKQVKNPYDKTIFNIGYIGDGQYKAYISTLQKTKEYQTWFEMMRRCYSDEFKQQRPTYSNSYTCDEWLNFQNFSEWFNDNYYEIGNETMCLDKDILSKRNKLYSPETCCFVPKTINTFYTKRDNDRGECVIGVSKINGTYKAYCNNPFGKRVSKEFSTEYEAFKFYKHTKENFAKQLAEHYKNRIPLNVYEAMIAFEVEIDD